MTYWFVHFVAIKESGHMYDIFYGNAVIALNEDYFQINHVTEFLTKNKKNTKVVISNFFSSFKGDLRRIKKIIHS